ncbi:shikimate kinase [Paenibacillus sp. J5C_2022]|uniref:shikimate kinase n=1 Tax=Paenibacillus sp. J5C2022 TaxID=2977129 RepID=UPI0021D33FD3|nr:shikimate kinase [Paenibacillus sp. J5C2022]MCU6708999.1 shikimate kinase [Paenibacillus sp. J5C2022]
MQLRQQGKLILVGFMGTGKSSVGSRLAERLGWPLIDSDAAIVRDQNRDISSIFATDGETAFREIESRVLASLLKTPDCAVVSTGGGAVLKEENRKLMRKTGIVVALKASPERIVSRVLQDESRPLLDGDVRGRVYRLIEERKHAYDFAHFTLDTTEMSVDDVAAAILSMTNHVAKENT